MDNWQVDTIKKLRNFVNVSPPTAELLGGNEVYIKMNSREAYVLLNICEQWIKLTHPLLEVKAEPAP